MLLVTLPRQAQSKVQHQWQMGQVEIKHCIVSSLAKVLLAPGVAAEIIDPMGRIELHLVVGVAEDADEHLVDALHALWRRSAVQLGVALVKHRLVCVLASAEGGSREQEEEEEREDPTHN